MTLRETPNIIESFLPIFYTSRYFGCNLFPLPKLLSPSNIKLNVRAIDVIIFLIHFGLAIGVTIPFVNSWSDDDQSGIRKELESQITMSSLVMMSIVGASANYAHIFIYLFIIIIDMINATVIRKILLSFTNIDKQMEKQGIGNNLSYKHISILHVFMFVLIQMLCIAFGLVLSRNQETGKIMTIFQIYVVTVMADGCVSSFFTTYWFFLENIADRFLIINEQLRLYLKYSGRQLITDLQISQTRSLNDINLKSVNIRNLSSLHHRLSKVVNKINSCYALQFIFCIAVTFVFLVMNFFIIYKTLSIQFEHKSIAMEVVYTTRSIYFNFLIYKILSVGSRIKNTKNCTQSLLIKAIVLSKSEEINSEINSFSYQIDHSNVEITCGLFTVDWTLFYTVSTAVGSYLLLFIQFDSILTTN